MYIFGDKTTVSIQNLSILVKLFGKNFIFRVKSTIFFCFIRTKCTFLGTKLQFLSKFVHFSEIVWQKLHFWSKKYKFFGFRDQMYICGYKTTVFIENLYFLVKFLGKNFIFRVKSTNYLVFRDQMYIFGYKTTVFIQNLYILVKFFWQKLYF